jgi:hypothetical protein
VKTNEPPHPSLRCFVPILSGLQHDRLNLSRVSLYEREVPSYLIFFIIMVVRRIDYAQEVAQVERKWRISSGILSLSHYSREKFGLERLIIQFPTVLVKNAATGYAVITKFAGG